MNRLLATISGARGRRLVRVERKIRVGGPSPGRAPPPCRQSEPPICHSRPVGCQLREATGAETQAGPSTGALADDVCRHIWAERGRFAPILYGSM